jgi:predicted Rossmann-fold nucleotide-binding protein
LPALEIDSELALNSLLSHPPSTLSEVVFQGLDLSPHSENLQEIALAGCVFLGCQVDTALAGHLTRQGCLFVPPIKNKSYDPFRVSLYEVEDLYRGFDPDSQDCEESYRATPDYRIYQSFRDPLHPQGQIRPVLVDETLARRIHDNSISDALDEFLAQFPHRSLVAIMGGHAVAREDELFRKIVELARTLRRNGYLLASGGGPGLMEATNLGSYLAPFPDAALPEALELLADAPTFRVGSGRWLASAFRVRQRFPFRPGGESVGIPTWFYGHEPPNVFASHIAKYFENSLREEGLLALAQGGIVFAPGGAGTIQEIFQDACQNYYTTYTIQSPMIFYPSAYWTEVFPVFPVMQKLAHKGGFSHLIHLCDEVSQISDFLP